MCLGNFDFLIDKLYTFKVFSLIDDILHHEIIAKSFAVPISLTSNYFNRYVSMHTFDGGHASGNKGGVLSYYDIEEFKDYDGSFSDEQIEEYKSFTLNKIIQLVLNLKIKLMECK